MKDTKEFIPVINFLRGIASLSVCAVHTYYITNLSKLPQFKFLAAGQDGVAVFLVISGFIIPYSLWNSNYEIRNFLGRISYSLYLVHMFFGAILFEYLADYHIPVTMLFLIIMAWSILVAFIFYILIEKPSQKLSKSIRFLHK